MKQTLLTSVAIAILSAASAQITITTNDIAPIYMQVRQANDTLPSVVPGPAGASQTWNYSAIANHTVDTLEFTLPQFTPYGATFPTANLAAFSSITGSAGYTYFNNSSSVFEIEGQASDPLGVGVMAIPFNDPEVFLNFPSTYNSSFVDTAKASFQMYYGQDPGIGFTVDSFRVHVWVKKTSNVDGWGTVQTPTATYNCIRQNVLRVEYDTVDIYAFGNWAANFFGQQDSNRVYTHWANGVGFPVCELTDAQDLGTITKATYLLTTAMVGVHEQQVANGTKLFPNPASNMFTLSYSSMINGKVYVYDMSGKLIGTQPVNGPFTMINVADFPNGIYFCTTIDSDGQTISHDRFTVAH